MRAPRRFTVTAVAIAAAALALTACGPDEAAAPPSTSATGSATAQVEVITWWASGTEKLALDVLVTELAAQHPEVTFVDGAVAGGAGTSAIDLVQSRLEAGDAPGSFQAHAGAELGDYVAAGQLQDLSTLYDELDLREAFPAGLLDLLSVDDALYAVPLDIHRANLVWANDAVLADAGLDADAVYPDLDAWLVALEALRHAGVDAPLALATTWAQVQLLETVLLADLGAAGYTGLWDGTTAWDGPEVTAALQDFDRLLGYTNTDRDSLDWAAATQRVIDGQAAFTVMGDWALVAFDDAVEESGLAYSVRPVPGSDGVVDVLADTFTLPTDAPDPEATRAWLETVSSAAGQTSFSIAKGSIPARTDISAALFTPYQREAMVAFVSDTLVPSLAHGAAASYVWVTAISAATQEFTTGTTSLPQLQSALVDAARQAG